MRRVVLFASVAVAVVLLAVLFSWVFQRRLIYLPSTGAVPSAASMLAGARDVQLITSDGLRLGAWYVPARRGAGTFTVLVANATPVTAACGRPFARALALTITIRHCSTGMSWSRRLWSRHLKAAVVEAAGRCHAVVTSRGSTRHGDGSLADTSGRTDTVPQLSRQT
jgi:hypothetical protein